MMTLEDCRAFYAQEIRFAGGLTAPTKPALPNIK